MVSLGLDEFYNRDIGIELHCENTPDHPYLEENFFKEVKLIRKDLKHYFCFKYGRNTQNF